MQKLQYLFLMILLTPIFVYSMEIKESSDPQLKEKLLNIKAGIDTLRATIQEHDAAILADLNSIRCAVQYDEDKTKNLYADQHYVIQ